MIAVHRAFNDVPLESDDAHPALISLVGRIGIHLGPPHKGGPFFSGSSWKRGLARVSARS
jgi:hypothetical protein